MDVISCVKDVFFTAAWICYLTRPIINPLKYFLKKIYRFSHGLRNSKAEILYNCVVQKKLVLIPVNQIIP